MEKTITQRAEVNKRAENYFLSRSGNQYAHGAILQAPGTSN